jgi:hypothetical protein
MAIITTENDRTGQHGQYLLHPRRKYVSHESLKQTEIVRQGISGWTWRVRSRKGRSDAATPLQLAYRAVMRVWGVQSQSWQNTHPAKDFFALNVPRVLAGEPILL